MKNPVQDFNKARGNQGQVFQGQVTLIQLTVRKGVIDYLLDQSLQPGRGGIHQGPGSGFNGVGQQNQSGFAGLGFGAGIAKILRRDLAGVSPF